jgi:hypothetical protein
MAGGAFEPAGATVIVNSSVLVSGPAVAVTLALYVPASPDPGWSVMVVAKTPEPLVGWFSDANEGRSEVSVIVPESQSVTTTFTMAHPPSAVTVISEMGTMDGSSAYEAAGNASKRPRARTRNGVMGVLLRARRHAWTAPREEPRSAKRDTPNTHEVRQANRRGFSLRANQYAGTTA